MGFCNVPLFGGGPPLPLIGHLAVWKQLRLSQCLTKTRHRRSWKKTLSDFVVAYLVVHMLFDDRRSQRLRSLRHELSSLARTLGSWVRIPL
jgi:hypothetical protein